MSLTLEQLAKALELEFRGDGALEIHAVSSAQSAQAGDLCYTLDEKHLPAILASACSAVILPDGIADRIDDRAVILSANPQFSFVQAIHALELEMRPERGVIHPSAQIDASAELGEGVCVGANAVIGARARIGADTIVGAGCVVEAASVIGADCHLHANVTVAHAVSIGDRCVIQSGSVIGGDGFGLTMHHDAWLRVPQLGGVVLEDEVDIGANCTIDRGALDDTVLETGVKIDNLVHIAHNCRIGAHTAIAGCSGVAGSTTIGRYCKISGGTNINGHITVADNTTFTGMSMVTNSVREAGVYSSGIPAIDNAQWRRLAARYKSLDKLARTVARLEKKVFDDT